MKRRNMSVLLIEMRLVWLLAMLVLASECYGCLEQERTALLQLKASINHPNSNSLSTWEEAWEDDATTDCCEWERVKCNNATGRVIQLSLNSTRQLELGDWYLNASIFLPFEELESLDLSINQLVGWLENEGFEKLARLSDLQALDLSGNRFSNNILSTLSGLTSLKSLSLFGNELKGTIHIDDLKHLNRLEVLDISYNFDLDGFITHSGFERVSVLGKLEVLKLRDNYFNNSVLASLGVLSSLKTLDLSYNYLSGSIHIGEFHNMSNLEELNLGGNSIESIKGLKSFSKLKILDLSYNHFNASIQSLGALLSLKTLDLRWNKLQGLVTRKGLDGLKHIQDLYLDYSSIDKSFLYNVGVLSSLNVLTLRGNMLNGSLPNKGWCELSNLQELDLSENGFKGMLPTCFGDLTSIRLLDLSFNQFTGNLALSPLTNLTKLEYLLLSHNLFKIPISFVSFFNHSKLKVLLGDNNRLSDQIEFQTWIPKFQLQVFSLSDYRSNKPGMKLPHFLFYQYDLRIVDLSSNILMGTFPVWLLQNNTRLKDLSLRDGYLIGPFLLPSYPNPYASSIDISNNHLEGPIPTNIGLIFPNLSKLNMSGNLFEGYIPLSLGDMHSLTTLDLSNNNLSGHIPEHLAIGCSSLNFIKLSNNNLDGQISPSFVNFTNLHYLYLDNNNFVGEIPDSMSILYYLTVIDINSNQMSGKIPRWMGNMTYLTGIAMFSNNFEGSIPVEFCELGNLEFLDLSDNNLFGYIPSCFNQSRIRHVHLNNNNLRGPMTLAFYKSSSLVTLDISDNNLTGTIPSWIETLSELSILLLTFNNFEGEIPIQLCQLKQLSMLDLSQNKFSGPIPHCLIDIPFETSYTKSSLKTSNWLIYPTHEFWNFVKGSKTLGEHDALDYGFSLFESLDVQQEVEFTTKLRSYEYIRDNLDYMSGIDLSCNHLTGEIPLEIGNLSNIHALNLSHNNLTGSIPTTFSQLRQIESLDLSYNSLSGRIPSQLIELGNLAIFSVAHNNLSGATPDQKAQFATFEASSYEGNPLLCGPPLQSNCTETVPTSTMSKVVNREGEDDGFIDMGVFHVSFLVSYISVLLAIVAVLFINPHWRQAWFHLIEVYMTFWYYFVLDNFMKLSNRRRM